MLSYTTILQGRTLVDQIIATVGSTPILQSEVNEKISIGPLVLISPFPADPDSPDADKALNDLVNLQLILDKAEEIDIEVVEADVERQIESIMDAEKLTVEQFKTILQREGKTFDDYKKDLQKQMVIRSFQGRVIRPLVKITDKDIETYYLQRSGTSAEALTLDLRQILISVPATANDEVRNAKDRLIKDVYKKLKGGMDFKEAVNLYSDAPGARSNGGMMSDIKLNDLSQELAVKIKELKMGEFTLPIKTSLGHHIFLLDKKSFSGSDDYLAQKQRLSNELRIIETNRQLEQWLRTERGQRKIEIF